MGGLDDICTRRWQVRDPGGDWHRGCGACADGILGDVAGDFSGKTILWTVPFPPGGGSGLIAQTLAPFLTQTLPGHPEVKIEYDGGSGSIRGANDFADTARPTGCIC